MTDNAFPYSYEYIAEALESAYEMEDLKCSGLKQFTLNFLNTLEKYGLIGQNKTVFEPGYLSDPKQQASDDPCIMWQIEHPELITFDLVLSYNIIMRTGEVTIKIPDEDGVNIQVSISEELTENEECGMRCAERLIEVFAKLPL